MTIVRIPIDFTPDSGNYLARQLEGAGCKNWYGTLTDKGKFSTPLFPFPGSQPWSNDGSKAQVRQMYSLNGTLYAVVGADFRIYDEIGGYKNIGRLKTSIGRVSIIANDTQILINDFKNGYVYQLIGTSTINVGKFFPIVNATTFISTPNFVGFGTNDATISGSYTGNSSRIYKIQIDGSSSPFIGPIGFTGTGYNDMRAAGSYNRLTITNYRIKIDSVGAVDTFAWSDTNGATWNALNVPITGGYQTLNYGISILFTHLNGHSLSSEFTFAANPAGSVDTFRWSNDAGVTFQGTQIVITTGIQNLENGIYVSFLHASGHILNDYWTVQTTTDSAFYPPLVPTYLDNRGVFLKQNSKRFYVTSLEDFSVIDALAFAQANSWPDDVVAAITVNNELVVLCEKSTEFWYDVGATPFPLLRRPNLLIPYGCVAPYSLAAGAQNVLFWLGQNKDGGRTVLAMSGYQVEVISNEALHQSIQDYKNIENAYGFIISWQGHVFYFLTFPDNDITWVYDLVTKRWHQRTTLRQSTNIYSDEMVEGRYLANCHVYHNNEHYVGDWSCGKIYKLSQNYYLDDDKPIICEVTTSPLHVNLNRTSIYSLQTDFQAATAMESGTGSDPVVMLQYSKTGTYGWSKELRAGIGKTGEYQRRAKWNRLGMARSRVFKIRNADPVYRVLMGAVCELEDTGS